MSRLDRHVSAVQNKLALDRFIGALEFHHLDPEAKRFGLGTRGLTRSLAAARDEAGKCVLVCSNCHAEVEDGMAVIPVGVPGGHPPG